MMPQFRPPDDIKDIDPNEFPFNPQLLPVLPQLANPQWREQMQQRSPQHFHELVTISQRIQSGQIAPAMLQKMQKFYGTMQALQAAQRAQQGQPPLGPQGQPMGFPPHPGMQQPPQMGGPQNGPPPPGGPGQQQRGWPPQPGAASPATPTTRPPQAHIAPGSAPPESPASIHGRRAGKQEKQQRESTMPPPTFIPSHGTPGRPPAPETPAPPQPPQPGALPVKEWEGHVQLELPITQITPLPTDEIDERADPTFGGKLPELSESEKEEIKASMQRDKDFAASIPEHRKKTGAKMARWKENEERSTPWWMLRKGETVPPRAAGGRLAILYPADKAAQRLKARKRREIRL
jgi:SWI/SNF-related matrix-associated actin-dependent regulator of chromatin subfamily B protein 1